MMAAAESMGWGCHGRNMFKIVLLEYFEDDDFTGMAAYIWKE